MQLRIMDVVSVVHQIRCDRCGKEAERGEAGFQEMTSIGLDAGYDSIFGDGNRVEIDLCEPCLRDTLGAWLRVRTPADTPLATMLTAFKPEQHGGEFPVPEPDLLDVAVDRQSLASGVALDFDEQGRTLPPSDAVILERAKSFCNEACFTVALQHRRLKTTEPEDETFVFRWHADLQFLIMALRRLRRSAALAAGVSAVSTNLQASIAEFDRRLPGLTRMRNVGEHLDDYVHGSPKRRHKEVNRGELQCSTWDGAVFNWLGVELDIDVALKAAEALFAAVSEAVVSGGPKARLNGF